MKRLFPFGGTLWCSLGPEAERAQTQGHKAGRRTSKSDGTSSSCPPRDGEWRVVLVESDRLVLCIEASVRRRRGSSSAAQTGQSAINAIGQAFRAAFLDVWGRVPEEDHRTLLRYWGRPPVTPASLSSRGSGLKPLIRVVDAPWSEPIPICANQGHTLSFTTSLVRERTDLLPVEIGRALAAALLYANRRHWELCLALVEEPMARWERRQGKELDEARAGAKLDKLEATHRRAYDKEVVAILARWGLLLDGTLQEQ
jgi:hypothetical protein